MLYFGCQVVDMSKCNSVLINKWFFGSCLATFIFPHFLYKFVYSYSRFLFLCFLFCWIYCKLHQILWKTNLKFWMDYLRACVYCVLCYRLKHSCSQRFNGLEVRDDELWTKTKTMSLEVVSRNHLGITGIKDKQNWTLVKVVRTDFNQ